MMLYIIYNSVIKHFMQLDFICYNSKLSIINNKAPSSFFLKIGPQYDEVIAEN